MSRFAELKVSEHARMRWLERVESLDVVELDGRILPPEARAKIQLAVLERRPAVTHDGVTYAVAHDGTILSVWRNDA